MPKAGHRESEYEDAFAVQPEPALPFYAAIADGATETAFARIWARRLAEGFVAHRPHNADAFADQLPRWQTDWAE
ncbi:MAG: protein phosphatase 2C domain-containing protein, partial [Rhodothermales bacterium]